MPREKNWQRIETERELIRACEAEERRRLAESLGFTEPFFGDPTPVRQDSPPP